MNILFVTSRMPAPTVRGDQLRAYYQILKLAEKHKIFLVTFEPRQAGLINTEELNRCCRKVITVQRPLREAFCSSVRGLFNTHPFQVNYYHSRTLRKAIQDLSAAQRIDLVHLQLARLAELRSVCGSIPKVIDLVDSLALNLENRTKYDSGPTRWAALIEHKRMKKYERSLAGEFEKVITISQRDHLAVGSPANGVVIPNGVNLDVFPYSRSGRNPLELVFVGNLGYFPNVEGILWFCREVLPLIRSAVPQVRLYLVGANPNKEVRRLRNRPGVVVTGWVPDVNYYLKRAAAAICPIRAGSGLQNKVLEAMASGCPVVVTPQVAEGFSAKEDKQMLIAQGPNQFAYQVLQLLNNPTFAHSLAETARRFVELNYSWSSIGAVLENTYYHLYEAYRQSGKSGVV